MVDILDIGGSAKSLDDGWLVMMFHLSEVDQPTSRALGPLMIDGFDRRHQRRSANVMRLQPLPLRHNNTPRCICQPCNCDCYSAEMHIYAGKAFPILACRRSDSFFLPASISRCLTLRRYVLGECQSGVVNEGGRGYKGEG